MMRGGIYLSACQISTSFLSSITGISYRSLLMLQKNILYKLASMASTMENLAHVINKTRPFKKDKRLGK